MTQFKTKKQAIARAIELRAKGQVVKVFEHRGVYTQPGIGITSYLYYTVA